MMAKGTMDVYPGDTSYVTLSSFGKADVHLPKYQQVLEVVDGPVGIVHIEDERFLYASGAHGKKSDSSVHSVH